MTPDRDQSELLLTAFRYVSGELSPDEAIAFEAELSGNQSACDALADVVELSEAVAVEEFDRIHPLQPHTARPSRRGFPKWGVVAALGIMGVACLIALNNGDDRDSRVAPDSVTHSVPANSPAGNADDLLSLWSELGWDSADLFGADASLSDEPESVTPAANEIPDWLLTAVAGPTDDPDVDMPDELRELMDELDHENL